MTRTHVQHYHQVTCTRALPSGNPRWHESHEHISNDIQFAAKQFLVCFKQVESFILDLQFVLDETAELLRILDDGNARPLMQILSDSRVSLTGIGPINPPSSHSNDSQFRSDLLVTAGMNSTSYTVASPIRCDHHPSGPQPFFRPLNTNLRPLFCLDPDTDSDEDMQGSHACCHSEPSAQLAPADSSFCWTLLPRRCVHDGSPKASDSSSFRAMPLSPASGQIHAPTSPHSNGSNSQPDTVCYP